VGWRGRVSGDGDGDGAVEVDEGAEIRSIGARDEVVFVDEVEGKAAVVCGDGDVSLLDYRGASECYA
jgi:hypothetical protein